MRYLLLLFCFAELVGCQPKDEPSDVAARASNTYTVQSYVVDGDTLYSVSGKNKLGLSKFLIKVNRKVADTVVVEYVSNRNVPVSPNLTNIPIAGPRYVLVKEVSGNFQLSSPMQAPNSYEAVIDGDRFYERTVGLNVDSLYARWEFDSLKSSYNPPLRVRIISAKK